MNQIAMKMLLTVLIAFALLLNSAACSQADETQQIEDALLEGLGVELLKPSTSKPSKKLSTTLDQQLLMKLGEDANAGQGQQDGWISKVVRHMQTAEALLKQSEDETSASSAQAEAMTGLDAIIADLTQRQSRCKGGQCQGGKCEKPGQKKPGKKSGSSAKAGKSPSSSSVTSSNADLSTDIAATGELVKDLWGKLPERQRQQILQPLSEEFLPKYASEIEAYFRALADPNRSRTESP